MHLLEVEKMFGMAFVSERFLMNGNRVFCKIEINRRGLFMILTAY